MLDIEELQHTDEYRTPLDELWIPGMTWIPIYFTGLEYKDNLTKAWAFGGRDVSSESTALPGATYFAMPWNGSPGYGCIIPRKRLQGRWNTVAHEIGHALGLSHLGVETGDNASAGEGSLTFSEVCIAPFPDDLADYVQPGMTRKPVWTG